ncbi:hypothetical protein ACEQPO_04135 [Bacillus sp. SL00103]
MSEQTDRFILGIETSCDETVASIVKNGKEIVANVVASQIESHKRFGGVVPEIASRHHVEQVTIVLEEVMAKANMSFQDLDAIAVTEGPGLVGALLIGVNAAKALSFAHQISSCWCTSYCGHIYANQLVDELQFPCLALVVSGGHTELVLMKEHGSFEVIGETLDDAAGEAYDKVARTMGLPVSRRTSY